MLKRLNVQEGLVPEEFVEEWKSVVTHSHHCRGGGIPLEETNRLLVDWCAKNHIAALGVGSPWEPVSTEAYLRCEGPDRDRYYAGLLDQDALRHEPEVRALLKDLNRLSQGKTLFYLDNETPKCRYGHLWWFGWNFDVPPWHDYSQDRPIQYFEGDSECEINALTGQPHRRRAYFEIVNSQRREGALGIWAHPTSWWTGAQNEFVTNVAAEAGLHLLAQGHLDGLCVMGYHAFHPDYQALWFDWLDRGWVVPGFAETDFAHNHAKTYEEPAIWQTLIPSSTPLNLKTILDSARRGEAVMSTGARIRLSSPDTAMGSVQTLAAGEHVTLKVEAAPARGDDRFSRIELIGRKGKVLDAIDNFPGGTLEYTFTGDGKPAYILVRAYGPNDHPSTKEPKAIRHLALSNPIYFHPPGFKKLPVQTECTLLAAASPELRLGKIQVEDRRGEIIFEDRADRKQTLTLPADAKLILRDAAGLEQKSFYISAENQGIQKILAYLWQGHFRKDYEGLTPGQIPAECWKLNELQAAMEQVELDL